MAEQEKKTLKSHEHTNANKEHLDEIAHERKEALRDQLERAEQENKTRDSEREALVKASELADEADQKKDKKQSTSPAERRRGAPSKKQLQTSFRSQIKQVQADLDPKSRLVSKLIHSRPVEATSDFVGSTIARPNAMLSGSICAFAGVTILYFIAKYYGFQLSGFETIGAFIVGWVIGILYDYFSVMIRGRKD